MGAGPAVADAPRAASLLLERDGVVVMSHRADARLPVASLTKLMTALLVVESLPGGTPVTIDPRAAREGGSRLGLRVGERFSVDELLAAVMMASANDACLALALAVAGDVGRFVARMNARAEGLGLHDTRFGNPCGHDRPAGWSSARDLRVLAHRVLEEPRLSGPAGAVRARIGGGAGRRVFELVNRNELVGRYPGITGVKTGYTPAAGRCLVATAVRGGRRATLVLLGARERWWAAHGLLDQAFASAEGPPR